MGHTLTTCEKIKKGIPLCLIGGSSTGKSHPLTALGTETAIAGHRVKDVRVKDILATKLVNKLVEAADKKQPTKTIARYGRGDLLCIDELDHIELDRRGTELPFQVWTEHKEKNSVATAANESPPGWTKTFTDPRLRAAIADRLTTTRAHAEHQQATTRPGRTRIREHPQYSRILDHHQPPTVKAFTGPGLGRVRRINSSSIRATSRPRTRRAPRGR